MNKNNMSFSFSIVAKENNSECVAQISIPKKLFRKVIFQSQ